MVMDMPKSLLSLIALFVSVLSVAGGYEGARGAELLAPFKQQLQAALRAGLANGGPAAIDACRLEAPAIAASLSVDGIRVGRTSHRLRNPANTAPDWVAPLLEQYQAGGTALAPVAVDLSDGRTGYVEPIATQPLCLMCHGDDIEPGIAARLAALYPDDRATGFKAGDLRGVFWVEYPAP